MIKIILVCISLLLASCSFSDESYYFNHPNKLNKDAEQCQKLQKNDSRCQKIIKLTKEVSNLAIQLQANPQKFGLKILDLQEEVAKLKEQVNNKPNLQKDLQDKEHELALHMAIIKWLESPEG